jgi:hypothetical protein
VRRTAAPPPLHTSRAHFRPPASCRSACPSASTWFPSALSEIGTANGSVRRARPAATTIVGPKLCFKCPARLTVTISGNDQPLCIGSNNWRLHPARSARHSHSTFAHGPQCLCASACVRTQPSCPCGSLANSCQALARVRFRQHRHFHLPPLIPAIPPLIFCSSKDKRAGSIRVRPRSRGTFWLYPQLHHLFPSFHHLNPSPTTFHNYPTTLSIVVHHLSSPAGTHFKRRDDVRT